MTFAVALALVIPLLHQPVLFRLSDYGIIYYDETPTTTSIQHATTMSNAAYEGHGLAAALAAAGSKDEVAAIKNEKVRLVSRAFVAVGCVLMTALRILIPLFVLRFRFGVDLWRELGWGRRYLRMVPETNLRRAQTQETGRRRWWNRAR